MENKNLLTIDTKFLEHTVPALNYKSKIDTVYALLKAQKDLNLEERKTEISELMFKRNATEIIKSGFTTGCNDDAIIFLALAQYCNLDPTFQEVIDMRWLNAPMEERMIRGHAFVFIPLSNSEKVLVDPQRKIIYVDYNWVLSAYKVLGTGKDPHEIGLTSYESMQALYMAYKENYQKTEMSTPQQPA